MFPLVEGYNHTETPLEIPPIAPSTYVAVVHKPPTIEPNKKGDAQNICLELKILSEGDYKDRTVRDWIAMKGPMWKTNLAQLIKACGIVNPPDDFNTDELYQKELRIVIINKPSDQDPKRIMSNVSRYVYQPDEIAAS